ncbi:MAG: 6-bladed beta-propeller [Tannerellaceae bacterium]|nr:6-bladed beta-propeller [Tannerellaceae bacterium]
MSRITKLFIFSLLIAGACHNGENAGREEALVSFDVNKNYPGKTIYIQDIASIEYLLLESSDDYLFTSFDYISDKYIIARSSDDDSFLFYDKAGKPVSRVAKNGQGPGEYQIALFSVYSDEQDELFVPTYFDGIKVYSREGMFKREIPVKEGVVIAAMCDYDDDYLVCYDDNGSNADSFFLLSKKDGHVIGIPIHFTKKISMMLFDMRSGGAMLTGMLDRCFVIKNGAGYLLNEYSSDTIFRFTPERELIPLLVRTPPVQDMETPILVYAFLETAHYSFMVTQKKEFDYETQKGLDKKNYLIDKKTGEIFRANVLNRDYKQQPLELSPLHLTTSSHEDTGVISLDMTELQKAHQEGRLSGRLKEIMDKRSEYDEDPFVLMIMKFN